MGSPFCFVVSLRYLSKRAMTYAVGMRVRVLYLGMLREFAGTTEAAYELPEGTRLGDLFDQLQGEIPKLGHFANSLALSVNQEYAQKDAVLRNGDEVALLPPVSGGAPASATSAARLTSDPIPSREIIESIKHPSDGAIAVFEGVVRDNSRGRRTLYLDYEGYEQMAVRKIEELVASARARFDIRDALIVHRVGRVVVGETSVLIVVASAHRAAAFDACRWLIDTLKRTVPIWKKEFFEDGAVWADGEAFPPELVP